MSQHFDIQSYYSHLKTRTLGRPCLYLDQIDSTIDVAQGTEPGTLVIAKQQLRGRGQRGNVWISPVGCAMASLKIACAKISPLASRICFLQHILVVVASKTLEHIDSTKLGTKQIRLKWPNDIMYIDPNSGGGEGLKIGGVLVHSKDMADRHDVTLSFGLNVFNSEPTTCIRDVIGPSHDLSIDFIVAEMMNRLEKYTIDLDEGTYWDLKSEYVNRCIQMGKVVVDETHGLVRIKDVSDDGYLVGERCTDGRLCTVTKIVPKSPINQV